MSEEKFYRCIPELNKECKKNNCYINGGECEMTIYKKYTLKGLFEEIERLNNIINGMEKFFQYAYDNEVRAINDRKVSVWTICLDKLQELKGELK